MRALMKRIQCLESVEPIGAAKWFRWMPGVSLADALVVNGLVPGKCPVRAIERVIVDPGPDGPVVVADPVHDRDRHLLECFA